MRPIQSPAAIAALAAILLSTACATAGPPPPPAVVTGGFVAMLGTDTLSVERYIRTNSYVEGDVVLRNPNARIVHYRATLGPQGQIVSFTSASRAPNADPTSQPMQQVTTSFGDTLAIVEVIRNGRRDSVTSVRKGFRGPVAVAMPTIPAPLGLYEALLAANPSGGDSSTFTLVGAGRAANNTLRIWRRGSDSVLVQNTWSPDWYEHLSVDSQGRITGGDWRATTVKALIRRVDNVQFDVIAKGWAAQQASRGQAGQLSPPDTARANIGNARIEIAYSRPARRGRTIWGDVVPWGQVWRTGANAATMLTTSSTLVFGNTVIPAGQYTLFTMPLEAGSKLIFNSQTGQWGTVYDRARDYTSIDLVMRKLDSSVEQFTISVEQQGTGGMLRFRWADREYFAPFTVR